MNFSHRCSVRRSLASSQAGWGDSPSKLDKRPVAYDLAKARPKLQASLHDRRKYMAHHKRKRPKHQRAGCLLCKPQKDERVAKVDRLKVSDRRRLLQDDAD